MSEDGKRIYPPFNREEFDKKFDKTWLKTKGEVEHFSVINKKSKTYLKYIYNNTNWSIFITMLVFFNLSLIYNTTPRSNYYDFLVVNIGLLLILPLIHYQGWVVNKNKK